MEQKETEAAEKAAQLVSVFETSFAQIHATFHPPGVPGEIAGKSSNVAYAARHVLALHARDEENGAMDTLITVIDGVSIRPYA